MRYFLVRETESKQILDISNSRTEAVTTIRLSTVPKKDLEVVEVYVPQDKANVYALLRGFYGMKNSAKILTGDVFYCTDHQLRKKVSKNG